MLGLCFVPGLDHSGSATMLEHFAPSRPTNFASAEPSLGQWLGPTTPRVNENIHTRFALPTHDHQIKAVFYIPLTRQKNSSSMVPRDDAGAFIRILNIFYSIK